MPSLRYTKIIPVALLLVIIAIAIAALVSLARVIFAPNVSNNTVSQVDITKEALLSSDSDHKVMLTVRGPIVANENFRSYQMIITPSSRQLITYKGYLDEVIDNILLSNNQKAYEQFVFALYKANLVKGTELTGDKNDIRGICATGRVYDFKVINSEGTKKQLWTSTCSGSKGSLNASVDQLVGLFTAQIPGSETVISKNW
jgi:hypothetical protein